MSFLKVGTICLVVIIQAYFITKFFNLGQKMRQFTGIATDRSFV